MKIGGDQFKPVSRELGENGTFLGDTLEIGLAY